MNISRASSQTIAAEAGQALNKLFEARRGREFLFLSSGGSSLALLEHVDPSYFGPQSAIGVLDERYSTDPAVNNLAQLEASPFFQKIKQSGITVIDTKPLESETKEDVAARFEEQLRAWVTKMGANGSIIASVGVGPDAHTSGIMPFPEDQAFFDATFDATFSATCDATFGAADRWVVAYDAQLKNPHRLRVTTTFPFLRKIDAAVIFITGENKRAALAKLLAVDGSLAESPCRIWREVSGATIYTDLDSAL